MGSRFCTDEKIFPLCCSYILFHHNTQVLLCLVCHRASLPSDHSVKHEDVLIRRQALSYITVTTTQSPQNTSLVRKGRHAASSACSMDRWTLRPRQASHHKIYLHQLCKIQTGSVRRSPGVHHICCDRTRVLLVAVFLTGRYFPWCYTGAEWPTRWTWISAGCPLIRTH